jgi:hypothetical protein
MHLFVSTEIKQTENGISFVCAQERLLISYQTHIPKPSLGWSFSTVYSFGGEFFILELMNAEETAYWVLDKHLSLRADSLTRLADIVDADPAAVDLSLVMKSVHFDRTSELAVRRLLVLTIAIAEALAAKESWAGQHQRSFDGHAPVSLNAALNQLNAVDRPLSTMSWGIHSDRLSEKKLAFTDDVGTRFVFDRFLPLDDYWYVGFCSERLHNLCIFITGHGKITVAIADMRTMVVASGDDLGNLYGYRPHFFPLTILLTQWLGGALAAGRRPNYLNFGIVCRESHIGHYIWNELAAIDCLLSRGDNVTVFTYPWCSEPVFGVEAVFPEIKDSVHRSTVFIDHATSSIVGGVEFFPFMSHFISQKLADRISTVAEARNAAFANLIDVVKQRQFVLVIGLRLENRRWIRQADGYKQLLKRLNRLPTPVLVIFDGHNYAEHMPDRFLRSHMEMYPDSEIPPIIKREIELVEDVTEYCASACLSNISIYNGVPTGMAESIIASNKSDFVITHWGAGLAKYKWISNSYGLILSSKFILDTKVDLRIYDTEEYRESATSLEYYPSNLISDIGNDLNEVLADRELREDFDMDPDTFAEIATALIQKKLNSRDSQPDR